MSTRTHAYTQIPGHGLQFEGEPFDPVPRDGRWARIYGGSKVGVGVCSCGQTSDVLTSNNARKRWHKDHKAEVR
jgi:hypothetical protein